MILFDIFLWHKWQCLGILLSVYCNVNVTKIREIIIESNLKRLDVMLKAHMFPNYDHQSRKIWIMIYSVNSIFEVITYHYFMILTSKIP